MNLTTNVIFQRSEINFLEFYIINPTKIQDPDSCILKKKKWEIGGGGGGKSRGKGTQIRLNQIEKLIQFLRQP